MHGPVRGGVPLRASNNSLTSTILDISTPSFEEASEASIVGLLLYHEAQGPCAGRCSSTGRLYPKPSVSRSTVANRCILAPGLRLGSLFLGNPQKPSSTPSAIYEITRCWKLPAPMCDQARFSQCRSTTHTCQQSLCSRHPHLNCHG